MLKADAVDSVIDPANNSFETKHSLELVPPPTPSTPVVMLSGKKFLAGCAVVASAILILGHLRPMPVWLLAVEVMATILALFLLGSFKYQIHKNPLTYGIALIVVATFVRLPTSTWHEEIAQHGWWLWIRHHLLSLHGLDDLIHADTMLFILGLTFFVAVIAQTRLLEGITFFLLRRYQGAILPTIVSVTAVVAFASGILDGVSMVGLTIRTLAIVMLLAAQPTPAIRYAVMICTTVTTVCGVWLAYGEPPNLIMKANLYPVLGNAFFLIYCGPIAIASYLVVARHLRKDLSDRKINLEKMDLIDANAEDVRFLQASRHGEVLSSVEFVEKYYDELHGHGDRILSRLRGGDSLGNTLVREEVPAPSRRKLLGLFVSEDLAESLDRHYVSYVAGNLVAAKEAEKSVNEELAASGAARRRAQAVGAVALVPFIGLLVLHGVHHEVPLFLASFAAFAVAIFGIFKISKMRALALHEAKLEYAEYYFLFPLFLSITLLTNAGFFNSMQALIHRGIETIGRSHVAFAQFLGCTFLSAILDNNVVADFASRALHGLDLHTLFLFAMAQIAGYALGGCWTHIGCAQSVVAYSFIQRDVDQHYTPVEWIKEMTPIILEMMVAITVIIYAEAAVLRWLI